MELVFIKEWIHQETGVKPIRHLIKDLMVGKRDSLERPVDGMITFLNINQGGNWSYNRDKDHYIDRTTGKQNKPAEINYRL